jgi:hypothetical protein
MQNTLFRTAPRCNQIFVEPHASPNGVICWGRCNKSACAAPRSDQAFFHQGRDAVPHGMSVDAKTVGKRRFCGELVTRGIAPFGQIAAQGVGDGFPNRRLSLSVTQYSQNSTVNFSAN